MIDFQLTANDKKLLDAIRAEALVARKYARYYDENEHEFPPEKLEEAKEFPHFMNLLGDRTDEDCGMAVLTTLVGFLSLLTTSIRQTREFAVTASVGSLACAFLDKMVELKIKFWETALTQLSDVIDVISEADDYGTQTSQLISPRMFRKIFKPRLQTLFTRIHQLAPNAKLFFHSDGNLWPIMEDLISIGFDAIHPIDPTSMDIREVKARVGKKLGILGNIHTDLLNRGVTGFEVICADGGQGLISILPEVYPNIPLQRCWAHKVRNILDKVPKQKQQLLLAIEKL